MRIRSNPVAVWSHHRWEGDYWGEPAQLDDWSGPAGYRRRLSFKSFPWSEWTILEKATYSTYEIDSNGRRRELTGGSRMATMARWLLDSGLWRDNKYFKVETDAAGRPIRAEFAGCRRRWNYRGGTAYAEDSPAQGFTTASHFRLIQTDEQEPPELPPLHPEPSGSLELPLNLYHGYTLIQVEIEGQPEIFLLDSGVSHNVVDRSLVASRQWPRAGHQRNQNSILLKSMGWARLPEIKIGGLTLPEQNWLELDLEGSPLHEVLPEVRGILGYDFLTDYILQWDFQATRLRLIAGGYQASPDDVEVKARRESGGLSVQASIQGRTGWFLVDTGNYDGIIAQHLPGQKEWVPAQWEDLYDPKGRLYGSGSAGSWPGRGDFELGPFRWPGAPLEIIDEKSAQGGALTDQGNLGSR